MTTGSSAVRTNAAFVANFDPETGTLKAPSMWPPRNSLVGRTSSTVAPSAEPTGSSGGCAATKGPRFSSTIRSMFGGRGADEAVVATTNSSSLRSTSSSLWLNRRSKPIVEECIELMPAPQRDPATWPG